MAKPQRLNNIKCWRHGQLERSLVPLSWITPEQYLLHGNKTTLWGVPNQIRISHCKTWARRRLPSFIHSRSQAETAHFRTTKLWRIRRWGRHTVSEKEWRIATQKNLEGPFRHYIDQGNIWMLGTWPKVPCMLDTSCKKFNNDLDVVHGQTHIYVKVNSVRLTSEPDGSQLLLVQYSACVLVYSQNLKSRKRWARMFVRQRLVLLLPGTEAATNRFSCVYSRALYAL